MPPLESADYSLPLRLTIMNLSPILRFKLVCLTPPLSTLIPSQAATDSNSDHPLLHWHIMIASESPSATDHVIIHCHKSINPTTSSQITPLAATHDPLHTCHRSIPHTTSTQIPHH